MNTTPTQGEVFKPVIGWEWLYEVGSYGTVRSLLRRVPARNNKQRWAGGKTLRPQINKKGYPCVYLSNCGRRLASTIHRLVALAHIPAVPGCTEVNHIDGCKLNSRVDNLEWTTRSGNMTHAVRTGLSPLGSRKTESRLTEAVVDLCRRLHKAGRYSGCKLAEMYGVSHRTMNRAISGRTWKHV